jgi:hypothetical protein
VVVGQRHPCRHDTKEVAWRWEFDEKAWWLQSLQPKGLLGLPVLVTTTPTSVVLLVGGFTMEKLIVKAELPS